ncbi:avidin/streptavidin family protein [Burkholderia sp. PAMC 26561]|uniref:avidin/streptavidin family protein n=1 Tax=Burkholderia sp. PAMC 26561 TaxID=1795043 RepID=UPI00076B7DD1|nr:avidin/streptavidin family protein [Burkholderia sp. PAMC 26561]AME28648.1 avidin [Burkholderia sp. PAMC 26561]
MPHLEQSLKYAKAGTGPSIDFSGSWKNDLGSTMQLTQQGDELTGTYDSNVSSGGVTTKGDLRGYVDGDLISFVVHWRDFQAITSWVGQCEPNTGNTKINTLWQMTKQVAAGDEWASINAGADEFVKI